MLYGQGYVKDESGKEYTVKRSEVFLLYKNENYYFKPDKRDPWSYMWCDFDGNEIEKLLAVCGFSKNNIRKHIDSDFVEYVELMKKMYLSYDASEEGRRFSSFFGM